MVERRKKMYVIFFGGDRIKKNYVNTFFAKTNLIGCVTFAHFWRDGWGTVGQLRGKPQVKEFKKLAFYTLNICFKSFFKKDIPKVCLNGRLFSQWRLF